MKLINVFSGQPAGAALPLVFHEVMGKDHITEVAVIIAAMLLNGEFVFFEDEAGDSMRDGGPISVKEMLDELKLTRLFALAEQPYEAVANHFVPFSSLEKGTYPVINIAATEITDRDRLSELPREHPFNTIGFFAWSILHPMPGDGSPGALGEKIGPGEEFFASLGLGGHQLAAI